jgi:hypothetical protein
MGRRGFSSACVSCSSSDAKLIQWLLWELGKDMESFPRLEQWRATRSGMVTSRTANTAIAGVDRDKETELARIKEGLWIKQKKG